MKLFTENGGIILLYMYICKRDYAPGSIHITGQKKKKNYNNVQFVCYHSLK